MKTLRIFSLIVLWLSLTTVCLSDVTVPSGAKDVLSHQDYNRINLYRPRSVYLGDAGTHTMLLAAPASLAADTTEFILPATNGTSGYTLQTDGSGNTSWAVTPIAGGGTGAGTAANARTALGVGTTNSPSFAATLITGTGGAGYVDFAHQSADAATPGSGSNNVRVIAKSKKLYSVTDNGSGTAVVAELGSGAGGSVELNYITNGSAATDLTGWTVTDSGKLNLARDTTAGELPRNATTPTGIKLYSVASADSTNACVYYDFTVDSNDAATSRVEKIQWEQKPLSTAPAATDLVLSIVSSADHTTVLATPAVTAIPVVATQFYTTFVAPATTTASLRICTPNNMADNAGIVLSNVIVGPGQLVQGAAPPKQYVAGTTYNGVALDVTGTGFTRSRAVFTPYRTADGAYRLIFNVVGSRTGGAVTAFTATVVGVVAKNTATVGYQPISAVGLGGATTLSAYISANTGDLTVNHSSTATTGYTFSGDIELESWPTWADGVGPLYIASGADNNVTPLNWTTATTEITLKYATTTATNVSSYSTKLRRVGDSIDFEGMITFSGAANANGNMTINLPNGLTMDTAKISGDGRHSWPARFYTNSKMYSGFARANTAGTIDFMRADDTGAGAAVWYGNTTAGNNLPSAAAIANNDYIIYQISGLPVSGWTAQDYLGKMLTGFATAKVGQSGIVNNDSSNTAGTAILGATDGSAASAGYVGQVLTFTSRQVTITNATTWYANSTELVTLTPGTWLILATFEPAVATANLYAGMVSSSSTPGSGAILADSCQVVSSATNATRAAMPSAVYSVASNTPIYAQAYSFVNTSTTGTVKGYALRIR